MMMIVFAGICHPDLLNTLTLRCRDLVTTHPLPAAVDPLLLLHQEQGQADDDDDQDDRQESPGDDSDGRGVRDAEEGGGLTDAETDVGAGGVEQVSSGGVGLHTAAPHHLLMVTSLGSVDQPGHCSSTHHNMVLLLTRDTPDELWRGVSSPGLTLQCHLLPRHQGHLIIGLHLPSLMSPAQVQ